MGVPSVQIAADFGDPRISIAGEDGTWDVCRESRSVSAVVDIGPQWSMQHNRPRTAFMPIFTRLAETDALNQFTTHTASAVFAVPPGITGPGDWIGRTLLS